MNNDDVWTRRTKVFLDGVEIATAESVTFQKSFLIEPFVHVSLRLLIAKVEVKDGREGREMWLTSSPEL